MTPIQNPTTRVETLFNEAHIRTRVIIERLNGVFKRRFPILAYGCRLKLDTTLVIIVACAVLHNICRDQNEDDPPDPEDLELFLQVMEEDEVPNIPAVYVDQGVPVQATQTRQQIIEYFSTIDE